MSGVRKDEAVAALTQLARDAVAAFQESYRRGVTVDPEFHRAMQRLHVACEAVDHASE